MSLDLRVLLVFPVFLDNPVLMDFLDIPVLLENLETRETLVHLVMLVLLDTLALVV